MNERAREALVAAALKGTPQCKHYLGWGDARCAMGVLNEAAWGHVFYTDNFGEDLMTVYGIDKTEMSEIVKRNNVDGWDFLTIACKIGVNNEQGDS